MMMSLKQINLKFKPGMKLKHNTCNNMRGFYLRAAVCKYREFAVKTEISNSFIFGQKNHFGKTFMKIIIKVSKEFPFWRNWAKSEMPCQRHSRHQKFVRISTFSNHLEIKTGQLKAIIFFR